MLPAAWSAGRRKQPHRPPQEESESASRKRSKKKATELHLSYLESQFVLVHQNMCTSTVFVFSIFW